LLVGGLIGLEAGLFTDEVPADLTGFNERFRPKTKSTLRDWKLRDESTDFIDKVYYLIIKTKMRKSFIKIGRFNVIDKE